MACEALHAREGRLRAGVIWTAVLLLLVGCRSLDVTNKATGIWHACRLRKSVRIRGRREIAHECGSNLSDDDRGALLEYLKTLCTPAA
jgi:hypothetical protein